MGEIRPFADIFPYGNIRHHFIGQNDARGIYAKELRIPAGMMLVSHEHAYDHLSILASGFISLTVDQETRAVYGPCAIRIEKGRAHTVRAITEAVWFCIHPTEETEADRIDDVIVAGGG
jgi:hypothetical protein